ncbi:MFS transporter [Bacillus sp. CGMCC 1.16607]|uniref:MFS transporter n=1 Tax=Bacillus sp. CGMCC 1.16607 TaxID=3351842 RepID=UPI003627C60E
MFHAFKAEKSYQKLFYAGIINGIGDRFSQVALLTLILQMTGSGLSVGITLALRMLPFLFFGPLSSTIAEKLTRKKLLMMTDFFRIFIALSFLWINSPDDMWIVYVGSFLLASGEALYSPTRRASIPAIINQKNMKEVNSWEQVLLGFVLIFGALTGGLVSFVFGAKAAFVINILSFLIAGLIIMKIPTLESNFAKETKVNGEKVKATTLFSVILSSSLLFMLVTVDFVLPLTNGIENVLISVYAIDTFQAADLGVGILYSVLGTGFIVSPIITKWIKGHYLLFAFICMMVEGLILFIVSQSQSFALVVLLFGILTIFGGVSNTLIDTVVMETVPLKLQGMYFGLSATLANTLLGLSMFLTGVLLEVFDPRTMGVINGSLYFLFGLIFLLWSLRVNVIKEHKKILQKVPNLNP